MRINQPGVVALAAVLALVASCVITPAAAELSETEAAALVLDKTGVSVEGLEASRTERPDGDVVLTFRTNPSGGPGSSYYVNATSGTIPGWSALPQSEHSESAPSEESAEAVALATARKVLGPEADSLVWRVSRRGDAMLTLDGEAPMAGEPPRRGLGPEVSVTVLGDGSVLRYGQYVPTDADRVPLPVTVSADRAVEIARAADTGPRKDLIYAALEQRRGRVRWTVHLGDANVLLRGADPGSQKYPSVKFTIDAQSGEVINMARARSEGTDEGERVASTPTASTKGRTRWPAVTGLAILCLVAAVVVGLARRRANATA